MDAEYYQGPLAGRTPAYAPDYLVRGGMTYSYRREESSAHDQVRLWLTGTFVDDSFGQDDNATRAFIPQHSVWDLTGEAALWGKNVRIFGGVYNLFNSQYFSRVLSTGVDPALPRNFFGGVKLLW
jgi:outer membrane receptor protein involved in Fe transport